MTFNCVAATEFHKKNLAIKERFKWANKFEPCNQGCYNRIGKCDNSV